MKIIFIFLVFLVHVFLVSQLFASSTEKVGEWEYIKVDGRWYTQGENGHRSKVFGKYVIVKYKTQQKNKISDTITV